MRVEIAVSTAIVVCVALSPDRKSFPASNNGDAMLGSGSLPKRNCSFILCNATPNSWLPVWGSNLPATYLNHPRLSHPNGVDGSNEFSSDALARVSRPSVTVLGFVIENFRGPAGQTRWGRAPSASRPI